MYKYLLFDIDDTLLDFKKCEAHAIRQVFYEYGVEDSDSNVALYSDINDNFWKRFERGEIERNEIFEGRFIELKNRLGLDIDTYEVHNRYFECLSSFSFTVDGAEKLLCNLQGKYIVCAITNGATITQKARIKSSGIKKYFNGGIYISEEIGLQKPQKEYFEYVLKKLGSPDKDQVLVIGDSPSSDILGAKNAGIDCCQVDIRNTGICTNPEPEYYVKKLSEIPKTCGLIN